MSTKRERVDRFRELLHRLVTEEGDGNFLVLEETRSGAIVQFASRSGEDVVLVDVPVGRLDLDPLRLDALASLGLHREEAPHYRVDEDGLERSGPEVQAAVHGWILDGRDPEDERVPELLARRALEEDPDAPGVAYTAELPPDEAALLAERVFRQVVGAPESYQVSVDLQVGTPDEVAYGP